MKEKGRVGRREFLGLAVLAFLGAVLTAYSSSQKEGVPFEPITTPTAEKSAGPVETEAAQKSSQAVSTKELESTAEIDRTLEVILTGDVMLGRTVMTKSLDEVVDPTYPFQKVADPLREADLVFVNLENPLVSRCRRIYSGFELCALPEMAEGLVHAGVDVVTLANNHTGVYGKEGIDETVEALAKHGILATGLGELVTKEIQQVKFGFLGLDFSTKSATEADFELVRDSRPEVDVLIVGVHWSGEYYSEPTEIQKKNAKRLVEAGADVVAGHGPHWVQDVEYIEGPTSPDGLRGVKKPVYYSLGNFVFDQMWSEETRRGLAVRLIFEKDKLVAEEELPVYMENWAQPEFVED